VAVDAEELSKFACRCQQSNSGSPALLYTDSTIAAPLKLYMPHINKAFTCRQSNRKENVFNYHHSVLRTVQGHSEAKKFAFSHAAIV
jgi:hypothetical protein